MKRSFNVTGACNPQFHYMVDIQDRLTEIKKLVDKGAYFTINRARQYGKTTTLGALKKYLSEDYIVVSLDFQLLSHANFENEYVFAEAFTDELLFTKEMPDETREQLKNFAIKNNKKFGLRELFRCLSGWCAISEKPVVLMIDEVDSATNNQVFLDFLAQLRGYYIHRTERPTFQSVILAGVYDVKNIKRKIRSEEEHDKINSPWNIATDFKVNMSFTVEDIAGMLGEYEADHHTGMDVRKIAGLIYDYTSGYPFLVSRICQIMDESIAGLDGFADLSAAWTKDGFLEGIKILIAEKNTLFESLVNKLIDYPKLREVIYALLFNGKDIPYNSLNQSIEIAEMFGFVKNADNKAVIANRIFETVLYNLFLSEEVVGSQIYASALQNKNQFIESGHLNMKLVLEKFVEAFEYLYGDENEKFLEEVGRKYFMLFLKPIINGTGNSYIEACTRNMKRTDIVVDYRSEQFVVELKIWNGPKYNVDGERQIAEYLDYYHLKKGYMLTFNFNKEKEIGVKEVQYGDRVLVEAVV